MSAFGPETLVVGAMLVTGAGLTALVWGRARLSGQFRLAAWLAEMVLLVVLALLVGSAVAARLTVPLLRLPASPPRALVAFTATPMPTPTARPTLPPPPTATPTATATPTPTPPQVLIYVVEPGDTLSAIAKRFSTTVQAIREANGMTGDFLRAGQELRVPLPSPTPLPPGVAPTSTPTPPPTPRGPLVRGSVVHVVRWRETLASIAQQYDVTVSEILAANPNLEPERLRVGQELVIPNQLVTPTPTPPPFTPTSTPTLTPTPAPTLPPRGGEREYTVQSGDSLYAIARRFGVTIEALRKRNGLTSDFLRVGQRLIIPDPLAGVPTNTPEPTRPPTATPVPTVTPTPVPPPRLRAPADGAVVEGDEVVLQWTWEGRLAPDEWFVVEMWLDGQPPTGRTWTKETRWEVPAAFAGFTWNWRVVVARGVRGSFRVDLGPPSETWRFTWRR